MYCPVYGCNSDSQKNSDEWINFFSFPAGKTPDQQYRRKAWIEFCKRKSFKPSSCTRICSLHFAEDAYDPAHSPQYLQLTGWTNNIRLLLKKDALPTLKKPATSASIPTATLRKTRKLTEKKHRDKVIKRSI